VRNNTDKKKGIKVSTIFKILFVAIVIGVIVKVLSGQTDEIIQQLEKLTITTIIGLIICSVFFNVIEGITYYLMGKKYNNDFKPIHGIGCSYYCAFFRLSTLGSGSSVAGMVYFNKYNVEPSQSFGMITVSYISQKIAIAIMCMVGFVTHYKSMKMYYHDYFKYIILGIILTIVISAALLVVILWERFHKFLAYLTDKVIKKEEWKSKVEGFKEQLLSIREESYEILQDKRFLTKILLLNMIKYLGWYMIPVIVLGYTDIKSILLGMSISALASALIGVIPAPGAAGSTEAMFYALFSVVTTDIKAIAIMLIYRCFTYIFPFIIGAIMILCQKLLIIKKK
jgi:uncharacterized membrane protein YbhN (UPF0104 family)